ASFERRDPRNLIGNSGTFFNMHQDSCSHHHAVAHGLRLRPAAVASLLVLVALGRPAAAEPKVGERVARQGDEIVVCGQLFHTTAPVVLWMDPGGYDAYRVERRFAPWDEAGWSSKGEQANGGLRSPSRFGLRGRSLKPEQVERVRGGGW